MVYSANICPNIFKHKFLPNARMLVEICVKSGEVLASIDFIGKGLDIYPTTECMQRRTFLQNTRKFMQTLI